MYPYPYLSQLHSDGSGWADCFQASLGAYLLAAKLISATLSQEAILNAVSRATRGTPDSADNAYTDLSQAATGLQHWNLPVEWTSSYLEALAAPWSVCLVDGTAITKADGTKPYPASWFNYEVGPDHFVVWGVPYQGAANWFMNPLDPAGAWAQYDLASLQTAFGGAFLLPSVPGELPASNRWQALRKFGLLTNPAHGNTALVIVPSGAQGIDLGDRKNDSAGTVWSHLGYGSSGTYYSGWAPAAYLKAV